MVMVVVGELDGEVCDDDDKESAQCEGLALTCLLRNLGC
jgi:hypothetical protein